MINLQSKIILITLFLALHISAHSQTAANSKKLPSGTISGVVTGSQSGIPLEFATVGVVGTRLGAATDLDGKFTLQGVPTGYQRVQVIMFGYSTYTSEPIQITRANKIFLEIELDPAIKEVAAVRVVGSQPRRSEIPPIGIKKVSRAVIEKSPGGNRDISKVVQNLAGVAQTSVDRNDLIVRGGSPSENSFYIDRIEIPVFNHFQTQGSSGGNVSIINADFLKEANLYTSAFPASRGNSLSSILDMKLIDGNPEKLITRFSVGASDLSLTFDTPLAENLTFLASYRISYLQFLFSALELPFLPTYQDAQLKLTYRFKDKYTLRVLALGSLDKNRLNTSMEDLSPDRELILSYLPENDQWSYVVGTVLTRRVRDGSLDLIISHNRLDNKLDKWQDNDKNALQTLKYRSFESEIKGRVEYAQNLSNGFTLNAGVSIEKGWYSVSNNQIIYLDEQPFLDMYSSKLDLMRYGAYFVVDKTFWDNRLRLMFSSRIDGNNYSSFMSNPLQQYSPRLSASIKLSSKWRVNANAGRYYQEPEYSTMGYRDSEGRLVNKERLKYIASNQYTLGVSYSPSPLESLVVEGFYKGYENYPMSLIDSTAIGSSSGEIFAVGSEPAASVGLVEAYGVEVSYSNDDLWGMRLMSTLTYYHSRYAKLGSDFEPTSTYLPTNWDYRILFNLLVSKSFSNGWEVGARWKYSGGAPATPYDVELSSNIDTWASNGRGVLNYSLVNSVRLPAFHQLDVRVEKSWYFMRWSLSLYLDVQNLYNYSAYGLDVLMPETDLNGDYVEDSENPGHYRMVEYANELGGTILPTFGIIIEF